MSKIRVILIILALLFLDLILETPEGISLLGFDIRHYMEDSLYKLLYYISSLLFHIISCTFIIWYVFPNKNYHKSFFLILTLGLVIITPLFYYFNILLNEKGEQRILAISNVYYFLRSPILLMYTLPLYFLWSRKNLS